MKNYRKNQQGFTLIELLVAITVFIIFVTFSLTAYIFLVKAHYNANEKRKMYAEAQQIIETIVSNTKLYTIDYSCYKTGLSDSCGTFSSVTDTAKQLALKDYLGNKKIRFLLDNGVVKVLSGDGSGGWSGEQELSGEHVVVKDLEFMIMPKYDPMTERTAIDQHNTYENHITQLQPQVTIYLELEHSTVDMPPLIFQTTVTSRVYNKPVIK